jgi:hypothetical protein
MNILADHKEYKPFFKNPEAEIPEVKNLSEFENDSNWYNLTLTVKTQFISLLTEWRFNSLVIINDIELQKMTSSFYFSSLFKATVSEIEENIMQLTTNKAKCEYLIRSITDLEKINKLNGIPIENNPIDQKVIRYLKFELEYYKQVMELPDQENQFEPLQKIKWKGSPAQFGYLFTELVKNDFLETPVHNGEPNFTGFAKQCWEHFEINTTLENLIKEMNPKKNTLSDTKRIKFPKLSDLA